MSARRVDIPDLVRRKATARGELGLEWLKRLDLLVEAIAFDWGLTLGTTLPGGTEGYVAEAETRDGVEAVLKLAIPSDDGVANEIRTLEFAGGRGYAILLRHDVVRNALLLERLGPRLSSQGLPVEAQMGAICATLREAWVPVPAEFLLPTGADKAASLAGFIGTAWAELDHPCSSRVVARALSFADSRGAAFDPASAVLVHGDAHAANTLLVPEVGAAGDHYKFVDPDGLVAERAYDLAIPMREWAGELLAGDACELGRERCLLLSRLTDVDPVPIWEWGFVERVSTGLLLLKVGAREWGREFLAVAEEWAARNPFGGVGHRLR